MTLSNRLRRLESDRGECPCRSVPMQFITVDVADRDGYEAATGVDTCELCSMVLLPTFISTPASAKR